MFIDQVLILVESGKGGNGVVHFRREKYIPRGGPDGGDGGKGGDVVLVVTRHVNTLYAFQNQKLYRADSGKHGGGSNKTGRSAKDLEIPVPAGTIVYDDLTGDVIGDLDVIENFEYDALRDFYHRWYRTDLQAIATFLKSLPQQRPAASSRKAPDPAQEEAGGTLYETHCGGCHYERVHQRGPGKSLVKSMADLRDQVARRAALTGRPFTLTDLEDLAEYLNRSHYRLTR